MGTVIAVTSGKGGTGKTSITGGVAASLALMGRRVLCIDMDVGLRNLDISLGLNDRAMMDFADVALGRCPLARAAVEHPDIKGLSLLTAPMTLPASLTPDKVRALLKEARAGYDHILIDSPPGWGPASGWPPAGWTGPSLSPPTTRLPFGTPSGRWPSWRSSG